MCINYVASKSTRVYMRIVWEGDFSQWLLELALIDIFSFIYERM